METVLRCLGVRYGQGFHLGRPGTLPPAEVTAMHEARLSLVHD